MGIAPPPPRCGRFHDAGRLTRSGVSSANSLTRAKHAIERIGSRDAPAQTDPNICFHYAGRYFD